MKYKSTTSRKRLFLKTIVTASVLAIFFVVGFYAFSKPTTVAAATANGCTVPSGGGTDAFDQANTPPNGVYLPAGTYYLWLYMMSPDGTHNSLQVSVDGGSCATMGTTMAANTWTWDNNASGTSTPTSFTFATAGYHTIVVTGANGVSLWDFLFTQQTPSQCTPSGTAPATDCQPLGPVTTPYYLAAGAAANVVTGSGSTAITWNADTSTDPFNPTSSYVSGGSTDCQLSSTQAIANANGLTAIYGCERWSGSSFTYTIPVANGSYDLELLFAEISPSCTTAGCRVFNVTVNGTAADTDLDIVKQVGQYAAYNQNVPVTVTNNQIVVTFTNVPPGEAGGDAAKLSGLEILPTSPPTVSISAPTAGATETNGSAVTLTAAASDAVGVKQVQFQVDGVNVGSAITASPYTTTWNVPTGTAEDGTHTITAIATNDSGLTTTSAPITVTVTNPACSATPTAPTGLTDTDSTPLANKVDLSWTGVTAPTNCTLAGYNIYRGTTTSNLTKLNASPVTITAYSDTTVAAGTTYYYQITAVDTSGTTPESTKAPTTPLSTTTASNCTSSASSVPTTPTLTATSNNNYTSIPLSWTASTVNNGCTLSGYHVYRGTTLIDTASATTTSFTDTGVGLTPANLASGTSYSYDVVAYDSGGNNSAASNTATATTEKDNVAPTMPTGLTGTAPNSATVTLNWAASTDLPNPGAVGVKGYYIYRNDSATPLNSTPVATTTYTDSNVSPSTTYKYAVAAVDNNNNVSSETADVSVTTPAAAASCTSSSPAPSTPTNLTSPSQTMTTIGLSWTASTPGAGSDCSITGYQVVNTITGTQTTVTGTTFTDTNLSPSTSYAYMVVAVESNGLKSANAANLTVSTLADTQAPTTPTNFTASAPSAAQVSLTWTAATDNVGVTGYTITRTGGSGGTQTFSLGSVTSYVDNTVVASTAYTYKVTAHDAAGNQSGAATASVTTPAAACSGTPSAPSNLAAPTIGQTSVVLTWTAATPATGCSIAGYQIFRGTTDETPNLVSGTSYTDSGLSAFTAYSYTVKAVDTASHTSAASGSLSVTTLNVHGCTTNYTADVNGDCHVNFEDLAAFVQDYQTFNGKTVTPDTDGDINGDGVVNFSDLVLFAQYYPLENGD